MLKYIAAIFMCVALSAVLLGCAMIEGTQLPEQAVQEQENDILDVGVEPTTPEEVEVLPPEQALDTEMALESFVSDGFVPDWDAITQRADELVEFFSANIADGITLEDVIIELGTEPTFFSFHDSDDMTRVVTTYGFDLMTGPTFIPLNRMPYDGIDTEAEIHNAWFVLGYIGIRVRVQILENEDNVRHIQIERGDPDEELRFVIFSFSSLNTDVFEFRDYSH